MGVATSFFVTSATATAAIPEQQPGVTLRTYDVELSTLCALKPGQTPNVDKLMSTVDWSTTTDFGLGDKFMTEAVGYLVIPATGSYTSGHNLLSAPRELLPAAPPAGCRGRHWRFWLSR
ncbi:hypothetical protein [Actinokineospora sp. HUAS TT18]|uniref:hypothetical protein n=1 Tax=Actinokineospora sp. HUAS TT18 TaxID=3447451 RepID=UPI003F528DDB